MIINKDRSPEYSLYYVGALVIDLLKTKSLTFFDLREQINAKDVYFKRDAEKGIPSLLLSYTLDWLYLIDKVDSNRGVFYLCS